MISQETKNQSFIAFPAFPILPKDSNWGILTFHKKKLIDLSDEHKDSDICKNKIRLKQQKTNNKSQISTSD